MMEILDTLVNTKWFYLTIIIMIFFAYRTYMVRVARFVYELSDEECHECDYCCRSCECETELQEDDRK